MMIRTSDSGFIRIASQSFRFVRGALHPPLHPDEHTFVDPWLAIQWKPSGCHTAIPFSFETLPWPIDGF